MPAPRNVLLSAPFLAPGVSGGPETYLRGLVPALARELPDLKLTIATTVSGAQALRAEGWESFCRVRALPCEEGRRARRLWAEQALLPRLARAERAELVHSLANFSPLLAGTPTVLTLHDLTFMRRRTFSWTTSLGMSALAWLSAHRADAVIAPTAAARAEILALTRVGEGRVSVVHNGCDRRAVAATPAAELRARYRLDQARVVLCVAAKRPHKNQELLLRALPMLPADVTVMLAGHPEPYDLRLRELARELALEERVRFVGYVPDADLEGLWALADCAAMPTLAEGFGLPLVEALAHGVPIAASDIPVLHETGGELPRWFDPRDPAACARAIGQALCDGERVRAAGPAHAARFSWSAAAHATYAVYEQALARARR
jgi:glycosyltransferase involved in cell wall biosynthesis